MGGGGDLLHPNVCRICGRDVNYHSEAQENSCFKKLNKIVQNQENQLEEMWDK